MPTNSIYNLTREDLLKANQVSSNGPDWDLSNGATGAGALHVGVVRTSSGYAVAINTDHFFNTQSNSLGTNLWSNSGNQTYTAGGVAGLASPTTTLGTADAADYVISACSNGNVQCQAMIIWQEGASAGASPLWLYLETVNGIPVTPNGQDLTVTWDNGASKIFVV